MQRARVTAEIATGKKVTTDQRLVEADFGQWEQKTREEFIAEDAPSWNAWANDPTHVRAGLTGETALEIVQRVDDLFTELLAKHSSGTFLAAAHNGVNRLYMAYRLGMPLKNYRQLVQENSSITQFTLDADNVFTLQFLNSKLK